MRTILKRFLNDYDRFGEVKIEKIFEDGTQELQQLLLVNLFNVENYGFFESKRMSYCLDDKDVDDFEEIAGDVKGNIEYDLRNRLEEAGYKEVRVAMSFLGASRGYEEARQGQRDQRNAR